jgi:Protein of unknown function (DUF1194)
MITRRTLVSTVPAGMLAAGMTPRARAVVPVDVALVLVSDVSTSVIDPEFVISRHGYAAAIQSPEVLDAILGGAIGAVAVTYMEFSGPVQIATVFGWQVINNQASAKIFADYLLSQPRSSFGRTAIGSGIDAAVRELAASGFAATRRVIDVFGDGTCIGGLPLGPARAEALKAGITVNGLAIIHENPPPWLVFHVDPPGGIVNWYRDNVIGGPGSFVMQVKSSDDFVAAMTRKLEGEIAGRPPPPSRWNYG